MCLIKAYPKLTKVITNYFRLFKESSCFPSWSKLSGDNHFSSLFLFRSHSQSSIENHDVSRFLFLYTTACRNVPSYSNPNLFAANLEGSFRLSHFHSYLLYPKVSKTYFANKYCTLFCCLGSVKNYSKEWDIPIHYYFDTFFIFSFSALVLK